MNQALKVFLTDKMVINSILLSKVGPPRGVTGSVETNTQAGKLSGLRLCHTQTYNLRVFLSTVCENPRSATTKEDQRGAKIQDKTPGCLECSSQ